MNEFGLTHPIRSSTHFGRSSDYPHLTKLPYDKTLNKVRCNAACTDGAGCANAVASVSTPNNGMHLASALTALESALRAMVALLSR